MVSDAAFRTEAVAWLAEHAPAMRARLDAATSDREHFETGREWQRQLYDDRWAGIAWPAEYGGRGGTTEQAGLFAREQARFAVSAGFVASTIGMVGPVLLRHGSVEQRERYLRPLLRADEAWCQLFSEPVAGSDLANLATKAVRDGAEFVVNGQKVWTSSAHLCDFAILLARTNPDAPKHRGISFLLLDMRTPGVEVRPLRQITGAAHFNEVFLTDVRVPVENVVGEIDNGWAVARAVLAHEAAVIGGGNAAVAGYAALAALARDLDRAQEPVLRQRLAQAYTSERILDYMKRRMQSAARAGSSAEIDGGWAPARAVLAHEASVIGGGNAAAAGYAALLALAGARDRRHDPIVRQRLAQAYTREEILRYMTRRVRESVRTPGRPRIDGSVMKVLWSEARRERAELGVALLGAAGALDDEWPIQLLEQFSGTIGGGTNEVHRTMIGERALGLPPEPRVDRDRTYRELVAARV